MIEAAASTVQQNLLVHQADKGGLSSKILTAIKSAAERTGVDFSYLLKKAEQESGFDPSAKASTSSATGLYQFTQQTWLRMVKNFGGQYGLGAYADHISIDKNGAAHINDPKWRQTILDLRKDPVASAHMAGELDKQNKLDLQENVGGKIGGTEMYLAHFLGSGGASNFLNALRKNPQGNAANILPEAAAANRSVFYAKDGSPRSLGQIYNHFAKKFDGAAPATMVADAAPKAAPMKLASLPPAASHMLMQASQLPSIASIFSGVSAPATAQTASPIGLTVAALNGLKADSQSLFATMVLAQMQTENAFNPSTLMGRGNKKDALSAGISGNIV